MFRRKKSSSFFRRFLGWLWPRSGWVRSAKYITLRITRIPDSPKRVAIGVGCGVFVCFTPFFGLHFIMSVALAFLLRANKLAAFVSTFFGNPITFPIIAVLSISLGNWLLGYGAYSGDASIFGQFSKAGSDIWANFLAIFTSAEADWRGLQDFYKFVLLPYTVGGIGPGLVTAFAFYYMTFSLMLFTKNRKKQKRKQKQEATE